MSSPDPRAFDCEAVLFDLDGVLVDSTEAVERAWQGWASRNGLETRRVLEVAHGRRTADTIRAIAPHLAAEDEARSLEEREAEDTEGVYIVPGAADLLGSIPDGSWAIVTSGSRMIAASRLRHAELPIPDAFVCAEDIARGKPDPEGYLNAAELVGAEPSDCVVVEDAPAGIEAARAAGMRAIGVLTSHTAEDLAHADTLAPALRDIRLTNVSGDGKRPRLELRVEGRQSGGEGDEDV